MRKTYEVSELKRIFILICVIATVFGVCVYSNDNAISESEMESLIVESFEFFSNTFLYTDNIIDENASPVTSGADKYYPGIGDYKSLEQLEEKMRSFYTEEMQNLIDKELEKYKKIVVQGDEVYYRKSDEQDVYSLPEKLMENIRVEYNKDGEAYVIVPYLYYDHGFNDIEIYVRHIGVYIRKTEEGVRVCDVNYVPKYFGVMPKENGDEITLDEVRILAQNAYQLSFFLQNGAYNEFLFNLSGLGSEDADIKSEFGFVKVPCRGFQFYDDWVNLVKRVFTEDKINEVLGKENNKGFIREGDRVYLLYIGAQYIPLKFYPEMCRIISNDAEKAHAEIVLEYHHDPMYENIEKVHLVAEFVKTEDGWRLSGGDYYDYLFGGRNPFLENPQTNDNTYFVIMVPLVLLSLTLYRRKRRWAET